VSVLERGGQHGQSFGNYPTIGRFDPLGVIAVQGVCRSLPFCSYCSCSPGTGGQRQGKIDTKRNYHHARWPPDSTMTTSDSSRGSVGNIVGILARGRASWCSPIATIAGAETTRSGERPQKVQSPIRQETIRILASWPGNTP